MGNPRINLPAPVVSTPRARAPEVQPQATNPFVGEGDQYNDVAEQPVDIASNSAANGGTDAPKAFEVLGQMTFFGGSGNPALRTSSAMDSYLTAVTETKTKPRLDGTPEQNKANVQQWLNENIIPKMQADGWKVAAKKDCLLIQTESDLVSGTGRMSVIDVVTASGQNDPSRHNAWWGEKGFINANGQFTSADGSSPSSVASMLGDFGFLYNYFLEFGSKTAGRSSDDVTKYAETETTRAAMDEKVRLQADETGFAVRPASV